MPHNTSYRFRIVKPNLRQKPIGGGGQKFLLLGDHPCLHAKAELCSALQNLAACRLAALNRSVLERARASAAFHPILSDFRVVAGCVTGL